MAGHYRGGQRRRLFPASVDDPPLRRLRSGAIGATVGVFAGFFFFPPVGIILGPFFGAVLGEAAQRPRRGASRAFLVGIGSFLSFVVGTGIKLAAAIGMFVHVTADTYPPSGTGSATLFSTLSIMRKFLLFAVVIAAMLAAACSKYKYETVAGDPLNTRIYTLDNGLKVYMRRKTRRRPASRPISP